MIYKYNYITNFDITHALQTLRPGAIWSLIGDNYEDLVWNDETQVKPSEKELNDEISRLQAEYNSVEYKRLRSEAYPSIEDQLDLIYHEGIESWHAMIKSIKDAHPKE
jgi:hypothetical protein